MSVTGEQLIITIDRREYSRDAPYPFPAEYQLPGKGQGQGGPDNI